MLLLTFSQTLRLGGCVVMFGAAAFPSPIANAPDPVRPSAVELVGFSVPRFV